MAFPALIVSRDYESIRVLTELLKDRKIDAEQCGDYETAASRLSEKRYAIAIVDCEDQTATLNLIVMTRAESANVATLVVAMVDGKNETRELFDRGVNFLMYKPVLAERANESLQAAWSLLPRDRRGKDRTHVSTQASIAFATTENLQVPLLNLSEDGIAIHSQGKMPPPCRVYFQFSLPGQSSSVRLSAEVIWQDWRGRVGLHFTQVPQTSRKALDEWLQKSSKSRSDQSKAGSRVERFALNAPGPKILGTKVSGSEDERRAQKRSAVRLGVNVYRPEGSVLQHCTLTDASAGGCYIETTEPLTAGTALVMEVRTQEWKLRVHGKVKSMHVGFGMGVEFRQKTGEDKNQVRQLLICLDAQTKSSARS